MKIFLKVCNHKQLKVLELEINKCKVNAPAIATANAILKIKEKENTKQMI